MPVNPPRPRGPSLNALRAFEAAARLGGFSKAAEELSVSPGAIAQHVKTLEDWAGAPLFQRHAQGLSLTFLGAEILDPLTGAFDRMGKAVQSLRANARPAEIHIAALPAIAQLWLSPRLPEIRAALPELNLSITALEVPPNLIREPFDLSIFIGENGGEAIKRDELFPVCAPQMLDFLQSPQDLQSHPCLSDATWKNDWQYWLEHAAPGEKISLNGPAFSLYALALQEAVNGAGVLMAHGPLVRTHLDAGTLVAPFEHKVETGQSITLKTRPGPRSKGLNRLIRFLSAEGGL
ncbi:LysR family transcriptional regulator [Alisedimentitalea sp. MJ-SS2]|uniref:LysR family transcriptional regulator n=1 Tax=Aliisedimentitalea sp. MJ-SS2 TaxID=3049795 RepID=UPI002912C4F3|nr:LysR family transcriptional regulator [Alisedimentitalea sp. MJ-SS2]MDU8928769.1 LysR family transcriptional regulator [Alisedimentitalea sp. MJ-SS2]